MAALYETATPARELEVAGVSERLVAAPARPVAESVTDPILEALATTLLVPATVPSVRLVAARPVLSVTAVVGLTEPLLSVTANMTVTPGIATVPFRTLTMSWLASAVPTVPVWLFPLTMLIDCACAPPGVAIHPTAITSKASSHF